MLLNSFPLLEFVLLTLTQTLDLESLTKLIYVSSGQKSNRQKNL